MPPPTGPDVLAPPALSRRLQAGSAALFPTDTLPALAAAPAHAGQLWQLKQRPPDKPLILMAADLEQLQEVLGQPWHPAWLELAQAVWPGAVTLVLPATSPWAAALHPGGRSLGLRIPACAQARTLLRCSGPLATTSANRSGEPACLDHHEAEERFPQVAQLGPVPWPAPSGQGSTVIEWLPDGGWKLLRAGAVMPPELSANGTTA